jgi:hypothetical protein
VQRDRAVGARPLGGEARGDDTGQPNGIEHPQPLDEAFGDEGGRRLRLVRPAALEELEDKPGQAVGDAPRFQ